MTDWWLPTETRTEVEAAEETETAVERPRSMSRQHLLPVAVNDRQKLAVLLIRVHRRAHVPVSQATKPRAARTSSTVAKVATESDLRRSDSLLEMKLSLQTTLERSERRRGLPRRGAKSLSRSQRMRSGLPRRMRGSS